MNIGFDLDGLFVDKPPFIPHSLIEYLYKGSANGHLAYRIPSRPEQYFRFVTHYPIFRPPIRKNINLLRHIIKDKAHKYYLISSRFSFLQIMTQKVIEKYNLEPLFNGIFLNNKNEQPHLFKFRMLKELHIQRYVDDDLFSLSFLSQKYPNRNFFWLNSKQTARINENIFAITQLQRVTQ